MVEVGARTKPFGRLEGRGLVLLLVDGYIFENYNDSLGEVFIIDNIVYLLILI